MDSVLEVEYDIKQEGTDESIDTNTPPLYVFSESEILARQSKQESNARSYPRRIPLVLKRAEGIYVEDEQGRTFIDCLAGAGALVLGHNHPVTTAAMRNVLDSGMPLLTLDLSTPIKDNFVQRLLSTFPKAFADQAKVHFCGPAGTDAVEAALKLVRTSTGRSNILAFHGAYHGMTQGALSLMGNLGPKLPIEGVLNQGVQFLPYPYDYRCPFGLGGESGVNASLHYLENMLNDPESGVLPPAAIIVEPIQGEGGVVDADVEWLKGLRRIADDAGVALIVDEVQSGFGRTGDMFAFEAAGIVPDVVVLSKAVGGGLPMAVMLYRDSLDQWSPGAHAGTFRGNQMAMAAGTAVIDYVQEHQLQLHAEEMGQKLKSQLQALQKYYPQIGDVRGRGLMLGVEMVDVALGFDSLGHPLASGAMASQVQKACLERGLIVEVGGRHGSVVRFLPPLIIDESEIEKVGLIFASALASVVTSNLSN